MPRDTMPGANTPVSPNGGGKKSKESAKGLGRNRYDGPLPDFSGQLRCDTGVADLGKPRIILIPETRLAAMKEKYPKLGVIETVNEPRNQQTA